MNTSLSFIRALSQEPAQADWQRFHDLYAPLIRRWATCIGIPANDIDDFCQDVVCIIMRRISEFEPKREGAFRKWIRTIIAFHARNYFRKYRKQPVLADLAKLESPAAPLADEIDREHNHLLAVQAMKVVRGDFSDQTWEVFQLYVLQGMPAQQVAEHVGVSLNAVVKTKARILKRIREQVQHWVDDSGFLFGPPKEKS